MVNNNILNSKKTNIFSQFEYVGHFSGGLAYVKKSSKYGYINRDGTEIISVISLLKNKLNLF